MIKNSIIIIILSLSSLLNAESLMKNEINHLLAYVKNTKCIYIRNDDSYNGLEAVKHINNKYKYFKDDINSAEDFIRLSATQSLMFKNKYYIKCPNKKRVESSKWLLIELKSYRDKRALK
ncbi:MAG: DUF5329 family protein [Sulfurimonadaceae bacterium]